MRFSTIFPGTFKWFWPFSVSFCWNLFTAVLSWNLKIPSFTQKVFWLTYNYTLSMQSTCFLFEIIIVFYRYSNYFYPTINQQTESDYAIITLIGREITEPFTVDSNHQTIFSSSESPQFLIKNWHNSSTNLSQVD